MPFSPFHFGHALPFVLWDWKYKRIDIMAAIGGSVIVDIEPIVILFFNIPGPLHGIFHSLPLATLTGIAIGLILHGLQPLIDIILRWFRWEQKTSLLNKILTAVIMCNVHVLLDAFLYPEMNLWLFIPGNPLYDLISFGTIIQLSTWGIIVGILLYFGYLIYLKLRKEKS